ncbi:uncharacterized protein LOC108696218 [Xenopus laevis]|uniref:Protein kinase domain-containing protein n=2 Tax=Xenopus laevis TaxID=8355 RepID=A0A974HBW0_XENLA|nr:uncharacterized protein LOC108696218 [Xenopus laevis]OCT71836.1 hypothetical protein XELAEV_18034814mg [Xenopus laevis]
MAQTDTETCKDCGARKDAGTNTIFHHYFCYDIYIVSAPEPQSTKQRVIDEFMDERLVKPLEEQGYKCFHGCRNMVGGELILQAMSYPITLIPTTIVPVYKDKDFASIRNLLLRPDFLERIVFLSFDSTKVFPSILSKNSYSINSKDVNLLQKLIHTINKNSSQIPLCQRKRQYEMRHDPESTVSTTASEFHRNCLFRRTSISRIVPIQRMTSVASVISEEMTIYSDSEVQKIDDDVFLEDLKNVTSPNELLCHCHHHNDKIRHYAANTLVRIIQKDITTFCNNTNLQNVEKEVRSMVETENMKQCEKDCNFRKLYFWILAAIYIRIYKNNDADLKAHIKSLTLKKYKTGTKAFDDVCQKNYNKLTISIHAKIKTWPKSLDSNDLHIQKLENCIALLDQKASHNTEKSDDMNTMIKYLINLPWDIKYIFVVIITEKIFEKKYTDGSIYFFSQICASVGQKHKEILLDVVERTTEHILQSYTKGSIKASLKLLSIIWDLHVKKRKQDEHLNTILKHFFKKLIYHPLNDVRNFVAPLLFSGDMDNFEVQHLGSTCVIADEDLVESCIREKLSIDHPDMIMKGKVQTISKASVFEVDTQDGKALLYMFRQKTLNDILQTNSTDEAYESFDEMLKVVKLCQGNDCIASLKNIISNGIPPFYVVEDNKPLLHFLHAIENQLTWSQMTGILIDISKAVEHCHNNFVILRDITPASFFVVPKADGSFQAKLANFTYAKCLSKDGSNFNQEDSDDINLLCFRGDTHEPVAAYFSSPETLKNKEFSIFSESWMLNATFYSVVLYGKQPFQELAHLNTIQFVNEIISNHDAIIPASFPPELWKILKTNFAYVNLHRMAPERVLAELEKYKNNLGVVRDTVHSINSICCYINPEDIQKDYVDLNDGLILEETKQQDQKVFRDFFDRTNHRETVSIRMNLNTRKKIKALKHKNILCVAEILTGLYTTTLVSYPFEIYTYTLDNIDAFTPVDELLSYFEQITAALQELHSQNILHCDLRCSHIYVSPCDGTLKLGHFGRAVSLEGQSCVFKMMPPDAEKWSAPEVRTNGMYSKLSDIFNLAAVFWEALGYQKTVIYGNHPLVPFAASNIHMEKNSTPTTENWKDSVSELVIWMQKCWHPNPTKRPSLECISETIKNLSTNYKGHRKETSGSLEDIYNIDEEYDDIYEEIPSNSNVVPLRYDSDQNIASAEDASNENHLNVEYAWLRVVDELVSEKGIVNNTTKFIFFKENTEYSDVGINYKKSRKNRGIVL